MRVLVTGANGHLGIRLIANLAQQHEVVALVRSASALEKVSGLRCESRVVDYADSAGLAVAARDCDCAVHLVGIIRQTGNNRYEQAHEQPCTALAKGAEMAGLKQIVTVGIIGSHVDSSNGCLASRGRSENILLDGSVPALIIRVPMVLGEGDYAARSLLKKAKARISFTFRAASLEQPIYAGDLVKAVTAAIEGPQRNEILELAGMESVPRRDLIERAGSRINNHPTVISLPLFIGLWLGKGFETLLSSPPVTADMIDLLDHDDKVDSQGAASQLNIELTSLDETLARII